MLTYLAFSLISTVFSKYREAWIGATRHEGFLTIAIYVLCFYFVAKFFKAQKWMMYAFGVAVTVMGIISIIQLFGCPFLYPEGYNYYDAYKEYSGAFTGTIGNVDFVVKENAGGTYDLYDYLGDDDNVEVPNNFGGIPVTAVQSGAFEKRDFNSIILPDTIETIKCDAFSYVTNVNYLAIDENTSVIEPYAFDTYNINHIYFGNTKSYWGNICESNVNCTVHYEATYWDGYFTGYESEEKCYVTDYECDYCNNANFTRDLGDGSDHEMKINYVIYNPNCNEEGYAYGTCQLCGLSFEYELPKSEHSWTNYVYNNDATTTADGTKTRRCANCGTTETITAEGTKLPDDTYLPSRRAYALPYTQRIG